MPSGAVDTFLQRFPKAKKTGKQWLVACPAHEDRTASLAVDEGSDGRVLIKCHAGCDTASILASLNLDNSALFPPRDAKPEILTTYDYEDEQGTLLYQVVRYLPKDFRQRRPNNGGWAWSLEGVRRVLYRLPELKGRVSVVVVEGEKDADAAWKLGIPATTNAGGGGKWLDTYSEQLREAGVKRVAILPDNDSPGEQHAQVVAASLKAVGLESRIVRLPDLPAKGDLSDYLAKGHTAPDLKALIQQTVPWTPPLAAVVVVPPGKNFEVIDTARYRFTVQPEGVVFDIDRVRHPHEETWCELTVSVNGSCPRAQTVDGAISSAEFNVTSSAARGTRAKILASKSGNNDLPWDWWVEELCIRVLAHERNGQPAQRFADFDAIDESADTILVDHFPVLRDHQTVVFGEPGASKSYFAIWVAGELAKEIPVLYLDWELSFQAHRNRLDKLFQPVPKNIFYMRCERPLVHESDRVRRKIKEAGIKYLVCDSIGAACMGAPEEAEQANAYGRELRGLGCGSLNLAHVTKRDSEDGGDKQKIFGSMYWTANARSIWFIQRAEDNPTGQLRFGLYHRKDTFGEKRAPLAYTLHFERGRSRFSRTAVKDVAELAAKLPLLDRMRFTLSEGPLALKALSEDMNVTANIIRSMLSRHKGVFRKVGDGKIALIGAGEEKF